MPYNLVNIGFGIGFAPSINWCFVRTYGIGLRAIPLETRKISLTWLWNLLIPVYDHVQGAGQLTRVRLYPMDLLVLVYWQIFNYVYVHDRHGNSYMMWCSMRSENGHNCGLCMTISYICEILINKLRPRQIYRHLADDILKCILLKEIFLNENLRIWLKNVPNVRIQHIPALVQIMAWCRPRATSMAA